MNKFVDAQKRAKEYPETFHVPSGKELDSITQGDIVKVCWNDKERFWVIVEEVNGDLVSGVVDNHLIEAPYNAGDEIEFCTKNIYSIFPSVRNNHE